MSDGIRHGIGWAGMALGVALLVAGCGGPASEADEAAATGTAASATERPGADAADAGDGGGAADAAGEVAPGVPAGEEPATGSQPAPADGIDNGPLEKQFPALDYLRQIPEAYRVAANYPELLEKIPCYCPCELYGHPGLDGCYRSQHAAQCSTCLEEAVVAGQMYESQLAQGVDDQEAVAARVKQRYRTAVVRQALNEIPRAHTSGAQAYVDACSQCHQLPHPAMYTSEGWRKSLSRMRAYANQSDLEIPSETWEEAVGYVRSVASRYPASAGEEYRQQLAEAVEQLQADEGDSAYYPGAQDPILEPDWFEGMVQAYRTAQDLPVEALADVECDCGNCEGRGHDSLLACLNTGHAISCERAVELVGEVDARAGDA